MKRSAIWLLLLLLYLPVCAGATSFTIPSYTLDVDIQPDGAGYYEETLVYDFDGTYNGLLADIGHRGGLTLTDLRVYVDDGIEVERVDRLDGVPYTYVATTEDEITSIQAYVPGGAGERRLLLTYRIGGLAQRYLDTARINHVLLNSESVLESVTVRIALPGREDAAVDAFVHGAMDEEQLAIANGVITLGPSRVAARHLLEVDILFPAQWLPDARIIQTDMREEALAVEAQIREERAAAAAEEERIAQLISVGILVALAVYLVVYTLLFFRLRARYGLKHAIIPTTDDALLDGISAAEAQQLKQDAVTSNGLSATLMELTGRGVLAMEQTEDDTCFTLLTRPADLLKHQEFLLDWLFEDRQTVCVQSFDAGDDTQAAQHFTNQYNAWKGWVRQGVLDRGWLYPNGGARMGALFSALFLALALAFFLLRNGLWILAVPTIAIAVLYTFLFSRIRKMTDEGERYLAAIDGFVQNYADMLTTRPEAVLGRAPLIMALGYMEPLAEWIDQSTYTADDTVWSDAPVYMYYAGWHHSLVTMDRHINEAQSHNVGTQSESSDSSSSGGGFSGGSGGGNSFGAW